jgi:hypothetical protein
MPGRMEFHSMKAVRNPGKKAGSPRISMWGWQALKNNASKTGVQRALHCRCGREKIPCTRSLCNLLHLETAGRRIFWWAARARPGARWLLLPCLRSLGTTQTLHRRPSSRTEKIRTPSYDFALPWVSCESGSYKGRSFTEASASARTVARTTPGRP